MRKVTFFAVAAGAGMLFTGCVDDVMGDRRYIPAPIDDVPVMEESIQQPKQEQQAPQTEVQPAAPVYLPMTDVTPTGGVDSAAADAKVSGGAVYIVKRGDYPERIARKHKVRLSDLMKANNLDAASARKLQIGQKLVIPGKSSVVTEKSSSRKKVSKKIEKSTSAPTLQDGKYTVKRGDSPERIARRFKVKVSDLMKANNLDDATARKLQIGQKLVIPGKSPAAVPAGENTAIQEQQPAEVDNTVVPAAAPAGDGAAVPPAATEPSAAEANAAVSSEPIAVELESDMTLAEVAAKYQVSEEVLLKINSGIDTANLTKGTVICVPNKK